MIRHTSLRSFVTWNNKTVMWNQNLQKRAFIVYRNYFFDGVYLPKSSCLTLKYNAVVCPAYESRGSLWLLMCASVVRPSRIMSNFWFSLVCCHINLILSLQWREMFVINYRVFQISVFGRISLFYSHANVKVRARYVVLWTHILVIFKLVWIPRTCEPITTRGSVSVLKVLLFWITFFFIISTSWTNHPASLL